MSGLSLREERVDEKLTIIRLSGSFEGMPAVEAEASLLDFVKNATTPELWLDFSDIPYIDSSGVGILITLAKTALAKKTQFGIFRPHENVKKVLSVTHVDKIVRVIEVR